ncbi:hypothetical protein D3870_01980 [Noviherbaspirillum cavernae]|uniref:Uncharacterized protein n=1 Tax=Noviherbaspirillum cavernae TaxID=2320862 RepID=A0A418WXK0_9BURK|nr:hypothetical protein D3870_01980 [Noviherbaspirillum cavernae]
MGVSVTTDAFAMRSVDLSLRQYGGGAGMVPGCVFSRAGFARFGMLLVPVICYAENCFLNGE